MSRALRRGNLLAAAVLCAIVVAYLLVLAVTGPAGAQPAPTQPSPAAPSQPVLPAVGAFARAADLAEASAGGVAISGEAQNGDGVYEFELMDGNVEIEVLVDLKSEQVMVTDREIEDPFDD